MTLQRQNTEIWEQIFPENEYRGFSPNDPGTILIAHRHMNVKLGLRSALFPEKEYIKGIFVAVGHSYSFHWFK
jgi:hypothetical protein